MTVPQQAVAHAAGTFALGGDLPCTGSASEPWVPPEGHLRPTEDHDEAIRVLRGAVELSVDVIDTTDSDGPYVFEEPIREGVAPGRVVLTAARPAERPVGIGDACRPLALC